MSQKLVAVKKSPISGWGIFAKRAFKKGEVVLGWNENNRYLTEEEVGTLSDDQKKYVAIFSSQYLLIAEPERYMNHSCEPNTQTQPDGSDIAIRDIQEEEEITGDYREIRALIGFDCHCGSNKCVKKIEPSFLH